MASILKSDEWLKKQKKFISVWETPFAIALALAKPEMDPLLIRRYAKLWKMIKGLQWHMEDQKLHNKLVQNVVGWRFVAAFDAVFGDGQWRKQYNNPGRTVTAQEFLDIWITTLLVFAYSIKEKP